MCQLQGRVGVSCAAGLLLFLAACSTSHYRKAADQDVYDIVQQVENQILHRTNTFTIDTPYSGRKPADIHPPELIDGRLQTNQRVLTIEGALELAATSSRRYQAEKERLYLSALSLTGARYQFTPQFFAGTTGQFQRNANGRTSGSLNTKLGLDQLLKTGGRLGLSLANDLFRYYTGDPQKSAVSVFSVNLAQPLLRGFGKNSPAVEALTQAERNVVYAIRNYSYFQDQFALEIVDDYLGLLAQRDNIRNRYSNYLARVQSTQRLEKRAKDREALQDVDQQRQSELTAKNNYVNAVATYRTALDQFKIKLGLPLGEVVLLNDQPLRDLEKAGLVPVNLDPAAAYRIATERQLQILNAIDRFEDYQRKVRVTADRLRADLNLFADASLQSEPPTDYTNFDPDQWRGGVGIQLDLPIDRLRERNDYRAALITFESELRNLTLTLDTLRDSIQRGLRTLEQRRYNYEIEKNALALADRRVASTTLLLQAGRTEVRDLVDAQDAQIQAQTFVISAMVNYQSARLQLMLDIGALNSEREQFWMADHLAGYLPEIVSAPTGAQTPDQPVGPPDQYLNQ